MKNLELPTIYHDNETIYLIFTDDEICDKEEKRENESTGIIN